MNATWRNGYAYIPWLIRCSPRWIPIGTNTLFVAGPPLPYVYFSAKLVISALQTNPFHVCSTSRHSTLKRFGLEHQSPCGPFILLRTQDQSALFSSQFYPHHHLSVQHGEFIHLYLYLQDFASLCWSTSSPVAVVGCFHTGRSRCFEGWGPWWFAPMADQVGPLWSCLKIIVAILFIRFDWTASGSTCFTGHYLRRWAQTSRRFSRGWATLVTLWQRIAMDTDAAHARSAATHIMFDF